MLCCVRVQSGRLVLRVVPVSSAGGWIAMGAKKILDFGAGSRGCVCLKLKFDERKGDLLCGGSVKFPARCNYFAAAPAMIPPECIH